METQALNWMVDTELAGFDCLTLQYPDDYDGTVEATLIRHESASPTQQAVLYIHGYGDYFFQAHLAEAFNAHGYHFYALDLRKYGRSLRPHHHANFCKSLEEYFPEIDDAIQIITAQHHIERLVLKGHSTGGLIASLYATSGTYRNRVDGLVLNSPFFDWYLPAMAKRAIPILGTMGAVFPFLALEDNKPVPYFLSLYEDYHGEWYMNKAWRPLTGFPIYSGWVRAINKAHQCVREGLTIDCPILMMSSDKSYQASSWTPVYQTADTILNVEHMRSHIQYLGDRVTHIEIVDGQHDLFLSRADVREKASKALFLWLDNLVS